MTGNTIGKVKQVIHDLGNSWYFRVWGVAWLALGLVVFSALIILSKQSTQMRQQMDLLTWIENSSSIPFPRFHLRMDHRQNHAVFQAPPTCYFGSTLLSVSPCPNWRGFQLPQNVCATFNSDSFSALNNWQVADARIYCEVLTTGFLGTDNRMLAFEIEGTNQYAWGPGDYASMWFQPNDEIQILLRKNYWTQSHSSPQIILWERQLVYHSTNFAEDFYNVSVIMGNFYTRHWQPKDAYNGWMAVGNIGGVAFFMVCIHTAIMAIVGLILTNTSTFLTSDESAN